MHLLAATAALAGLAAAIPPQAGGHGHFVVHEKREAQPLGWTRQDRASKDTVLPVRIGLKQNNLHRLDEYIDDIANPESPNFGASLLH